MEVLSFRELGPNEGRMMVTLRGGAKDGLRFRTVMATMADGTTKGLWASNAGDQLYKYGFLPWDFVHPEFIEG